MGLFDAIMLWVQRPLPLDQLPFELLVEEHALRPQEVQDVFVRRLYPTVFQAAQANIRRKGEVPTETMAGALANVVFTQFAPEFASGRPEMVLVRFASIIRRTLGNDAFKEVAPRYYAQLPIFYIENDEQRRFLAAAYSDGLAPELDKRLAARFCVSREHCRAILKQANRAYQAVIDKEFRPEELSRLTEGYLP